MQTAAEVTHGIPYLGEAMVFLLAAVIVAPLFRKLRASPVLGYLLAGVMLGPHGLGLVADVKGVSAFAELGVVFLLFTVGLELSLDRLRAMRRYVFGLGAVQVVVCGAAIGAIALAVGLPGPAAVIVGGALALSSTAVVLQLLIERGEFASQEGRISFAVLLFQDLMVAPLLVLATTLGQAGDGLVLAFAVAAVKAAAAFAVIIVVGRLVLGRLFQLVAGTRIPEVFTALALLAVLGTAWGTATLGLSMALGAFLAGLLLSESAFRHQVEADIAPYKGLLLGLFFAAIGMAVDLNIVVNELGLVLFLVVALTVLKATLITLIALAMRVPAISALRVGLLLAECGEFAFILLGVAGGGGVVERSTLHVLLVVVALSMALTPFLAGAGKWLARAFEHRRRLGALATIEAETSDLKGHLLIAGFGRVGQTVGKLLEARGIPYVALDLEPTRVAVCNRRGSPVYYGDSANAEVLRAAGAARAGAAVITLDDARAAEKSVRALRSARPDITILVRSRDMEHAKELGRAGADSVVPEMMEASLQLAAHALRVAGLPSDDIANLIDDYRQADYSALADIVPPGPGAAEFGRPGDGA